MYFMKWTKTHFEMSIWKVFSIYIINICSLYNALTTNQPFHLPSSDSFANYPLAIFILYASMQQRQRKMNLVYQFHFFAHHITLWWNSWLYDYPRLRISTRLLKGVEERVWLNYFHFSFSEKLTAQWDWENVCLILDIWTVLKRYPDTVMVSPAFDGFSPGAAIQMLCVGDVMLWSVSQCLHADAGRAIVTM